MLFLAYPKCTTCQRAKKFLDERGVSFTQRHIKQEHPTADELRAWRQTSGLPLKKFLTPPECSTGRWSSRTSSPL